MEKKANLLWVGGLQKFSAYARVMPILLGTFGTSVMSSIAGLDDFNRMTQAAYATISCLMAIPVVDITEMLGCIKTFLSTMDMFETTVWHQHKKTHFWDKANFISLLNLPEQIDCFGPLQLYWEGSHEHYIQHVKPVLKNMRQTSSYSKTKMEEVYKETTASLLTEKYCFNITYQKYKSLKLYNAINDIAGLISSRKLLA
eukprot:2590018-Ditylum_brightwellii.AAC.1